MTGEPSPSSSQRSSRARRIRWNGVVGLVSLAGLVIATFTVVDEARDQALRPGSMAVAFVLHAVALACGARAWVALFPPGTDRRALAKGIYLSQLAKYLPAGGFLQTASQVALSSGTSGVAVAALRLPVFSLCFVVAGSTLGSALAFDADLPLWGRLLAATGIVAVAALDRRVLQALLRAARRLVRRLPEPDALPSQRAVLRCYGFALANLVTFAAAFVVLLRDIASVDALEAGAALCAAWVAGYLVLVIPGGVGVREAVLVAAIPNLATGAIVAASVVHRLAGLLAEATMAGAAQLRQILARRTGPTTVLRSSAVPFTRRGRLGRSDRATSAPTDPPASTPAVPDTAATAAAAPDTGAAILDAYIADPPSPQQAVDIFAGEWSSQLPEHLGVEAGSASLFVDDRIVWLLEQTGDLTGRKVLELGPLEGGHSYQLSAAGAQVTAIEANTRAYLKCLVAKELLGMTTCTFLLGNFVAYLEAHSDEHFDMVLASGVLYHSTDPLHLLELIGGVTDRVALWTHYYDPEVVSSRPSVARHFQPEPITTEFRGRELALHRRDYLEALQWTGFCGGPEDHALWLERADLLAVLELLGFRDIRLGSDDPAHVNGPCVMLYAER